MSILSDFEDRIASAVEGLFAGAFRSPVQPAEIAKALARAMDDRKAVGVGKLYAPHVFTVALSEEDDDAIAPFRPTLAGELATFLLGHAAERGYHLTARPHVTFAVHDDLKIGRIRVAAEAAPEAGSGPGTREALTALPAETPGASGPLAVPPAATRPSGAPGPHAMATVTVSGVEHDVVLSGERMTVGRLASCDITLADANVSREHAAFVREGAGWAIEDLGSTNGTLLNGQPCTWSRLRDGDRITIGTSELTYHEPRG